MKKFFSYSLLSLLFTFIILSCTKSTDLTSDSINSALEIRTARKLTDTQIDSIGIMHNYRLNGIMNNIDFNSLPLENQFDSLLLLDGLSASFIDTFKGWWSNDPLNNYNDSTFNFYYAKIDSILAEDVINYSSFCNDLSKLETEIRANVSDGIVLDHLLVIISVAKYSFYYWAPTIKGGSGIGYDFLGQIDKVSSSLEIRRPKWQTVMAADASGAAWGFLQFGVSAFFGPVGATSLAVGVVGSAVAGSVSGAGLLP